MNMGKVSFDEWSDEALLKEAKSLKKSHLEQAFYVGFLVGILIFSLFKGGWTLLMIIPLYMIRGLARQSQAKKIKQIDEILRNRKLVK